MASAALRIEDPDGPLTLAYTDWGPRDAARTVVCVHGLTRNGRDFDALAGRLARRWRVLCPDVAGRGRSGWLQDPERYGVPTYVQHLLQFLAKLDIEQVDWVGTSMGGLIGMGVAALDPSPIRRLVLNDVGAELPAAALARIGSYLGQAQAFADLAALEAHLRLIHAPFGPLSDAQWRHLATHSARALPDSRLGLAYDPRIAAPFKAAPPETVEMWPLWQAIRCPVLLLRGAESDLLPPATARRMTAAGPPTRLVELPGIGHAPALMADDQIALIEDFLAA